MEERAESWWTLTTRTRTRPPAPSPRIGLLECVLDEQRHDADREVAGNAAADLEEADRAALGGLRLVPLRERLHLLDVVNSDAWHVVLAIVGAETTTILAVKTQPALLTAMVE